jgi:hypothetical protein
MSYSELLKDPRWQKKRLEILNRDNFQCRNCHSKIKTLHVHHQYYIKGNDPWEYDDNALISLCDQCHGRVNEIDWQRAFLDLNLTSSQLLELALVAKFVLLKSKNEHGDINFNPSNEYFFPYLNSITGDELDSFYNDFKPSLKDTYHG